MEGEQQPDEPYFCALELRCPDAAHFVDFLDSLPPDEPPSPYIDAYLEANPDCSIDAEHMHNLVEGARLNETTVSAAWFFSQQMVDELIGSFERAKPIIERNIIQNRRYDAPGVDGLHIWMYELSLPTDEARREFQHILHQVFLDDFLLADDFEARIAVDQALADHEGAFEAEPPPNDRQLLPAEPPPEEQDGRHVRR